MASSGGGYSKTQWAKTPTLEQFAQQHSVDIEYERLRARRFFEKLRQTKGNGEAAQASPEPAFVYAVEELWYSVKGLREFTPALERLAVHELGAGTRLEASTQTVFGDRSDDRRAARDVTHWTLKVPIRRNSFFSLQQFVLNVNFLFFLLAISVVVCLGLLAIKQLEL